MRKKTEDVASKIFAPMPNLVKQIERKNYYGADKYLKVRWTTSAIARAIRHRVWMKIRGIE